MAVLALYAVGAAIGSAAVGGATTAVAFGLSGAAIGGVAGGLVGSFVDQNFLFPALFGGKTGTRGPRIADLQAQTASEGSPMNFCLGPQNRIAGTLIWCTKLKEKKHKQSEGKGGSATSYTYSVSLAIGICEGRVGQVTRVWANGKLIYTIDLHGTGSPWQTKKVKSLTFYPGSETQVADPVMSAAFGAENTPAYRGVCYAVFEDFQLADFGNTIPTFQFEVEQSADLTVASCILGIMERAGFDDSEVDVALVHAAGQTYFGGYAWSGPQNTISLLEPLLAAFDLKTRETNGVIYFIRRGYETQVPVEARHLTARETGGGQSDLPHRPLLITDTPDHVIPNEVKVRFIDAAYDYGQSEYSEHVINAPYTGVNQIDLPLTITTKQARSVANTRLVRQLSERRTAELDLPPSYFHVDENDVLLVPYNGNTYDVRVDEVNRGNNWLVNVKGTIVGITNTINKASGCRLGGGAGGAGGGNGGGASDVYDPAAVVVHVAILDVPALADADADRPGVYYAIGVSADTNWQGGRLYSSPDGATGWADEGPAVPIGVVGYTTATLAPGPVGYWDDANAVDVTLETEGTLGNASDLDVLNGANRVYVGNELIAFGTATLLGVGQYRLKHLLRGLNNSEASAALSHGSGARVVVFGDDDVVFGAVGTADVGANRYYEVVPTAGAVGDFPTHGVTFHGNSLKQWSPVNVAGAGNGGGDLVLSWHRRTRSPGWRVVTATTAAPLMAAAESYVVEVRDATGTTLLATLTATGSSSVTWTTADAAGAGVSSGDTLKVTVYQLNDLAMRGYPSDVATVTYP